MAWIFSIITFAGVVSQANSTCSERSVSSISSIEEKAPQNKSNFQQDDFSHKHSQDSDCHHSRSGCRNCHLGQAPFTLTPSIQVSVFDPNQMVYFITVSVIIYDFQTSLFRPPIA